MYFDALIFFFTDGYQTWYQTHRPIDQSTFLSNDMGVTTSEFIQFCLVLFTGCGFACSTSCFQLSLLAREVVVAVSVPSILHIELSNYLLAFALLILSFALCGLVWFGLVLWHINHSRLSNAKSFLSIYIKYMTSEYIL